MDHRVIKRGIGDVASMSSEHQQSLQSNSDDKADETPLLPLSFDKESCSTSTSDAVSNKSKSIQLIIGAGGIWASFIYYGSLQEDVFRYEAADGSKFSMAWFLQVLESMANVIVGTVALVVLGVTKKENNNYGTKRWWGGTPNLPKRPFLSSGLSQVCSKGFTSLALANGLSFPVATLAKSAKMAPVMAGSLILGGAKYYPRDYLQVLAIVAGTAILSLSKKKSSTSDSSPLGVAFIVLSLVMDGVTGGVQKKLLTDLKSVNIQPQPYDLMTFTNLFMMIFALLISLSLGEFKQGLSYCASNPEVFGLIWKFSLCSAVGQSFIFYTLARFDPLVCSTVTTTRKIFSVTLSILFKGHLMAPQGWCGLGLAVGGIASEVYHKASSYQGRLTKSQR